jgi:hypothetical protein
MSEELMTIAEMAQELGILGKRIYDAYYRGEIRPAGTDGGVSGGALLFGLDTLEFLRVYVNAGAPPGSITLKQAADRLHLREKQVRYYLHKGYLKGHLFASRRCFTVAEIESFVDPVHRAPAIDAHIDYDRDSTIYLAGLVDGEGCIGVASYIGAASRRARLTISNNYLPALEWVNQVFGPGCLSKSHASPEHRCWSWVVEGRRAYHPLKAIAPYLKIKHEQARLALEIQRRTSLQQIDSEWLLSACDRLRNLNSRRGGTP